MQLNLSYIIATRNRLPFLKITLDNLINRLQPDEEIVVVDGNSTDGAKEYLQQLYENGKIQQFISEPDYNQAHGWNKALLLAKGTLIKKIIDDDVHSYMAICRCKEFMLTNPLVDICISNCLMVSYAEPENVQVKSRLKYFDLWRAGQITCFTFSDVYMLIRKDSISYLGLFDTQFSMIDWEYSLRCSYLKANIAYYTGFNALAVGTPGNITSSISKKTLEKEGMIGKVKYGYHGDGVDIPFYSKLKIAIGKAINYKSGPKLSFPDNKGELLLSGKSEIYQYLYATLEKYNQADSFTFINK